MKLMHKSAVGDHESTRDGQQRSARLLARYTTISARHDESTFKGAREDQGSPSVRERFTREPKEVKVFETAPNWNPQNLFALASHYLAMRSI
ncbi:hypothetical protein N7523_008439 [Penicillium sp. IBT 18751x]|nr:hypothetical protein N7523_008439 [Penicillium sp. IBT 18751x]